MKTSTEIHSLSNLVGETKAVEYVAKAGFDAWDFSMFKMCRYDRVNQVLQECTHPLAQSNYLAFARELKKIGLDNGIHCNQSHAPFPTCQHTMPFVKRAIECAAEAGAEYCIIHPLKDATAAENAEMYLELLPFARDHGVKIATENMWNWDAEKDQASPAPCSSPESFNAHLDAVNDEAFVACLDIGHAEMRGVHTSAVEQIRALGSRLKCLHIHDNDRWHDSHQIPFSMNIDFEPVVKALKQIGYSGYFTLECDCYLKKYTPETAFQGVQELAAAAKRLAEMFENA